MTDPIEPPSLDETSWGIAWSPEIVRADPALGLSGDPVSDGVDVARDPKRTLQSHWTGLVARGLIGRQRTPKEEAHRAAMHARYAEMDRIFGVGGPRIW